MRVCVCVCAFMSLASTRSAVYDERLLRAVHRDQFL